MSKEPRIAVEVKVGDKMVYPGHGVAQVMGVEWREVSGTKKEFYILKILNNELKILIPIDGVDRSGLRFAISKEKVQEIFEILKAPCIMAITQPWSKRCREYSDMLNSGSLFEVAQLFRNLYRIKENKELSRSEQRFYDHALCLLVTEIALSTGSDLSSVNEKIQDALDPSSLQSPRPNIDE